MTRPTSLDWRDRWGINWITGIRNQNPCSACWAFSTAALIEAMVRIEHATWCVRSEGDLHHGMGANCPDGNWPENALNWIKSNGIADPDCFAWENSNPSLPYRPSSDRSGRTVRLSESTPVGQEQFWFIILGQNIETQKRWIDLVGPIVAVFEVYTDFSGYGNGVYRKSNQPANRLIGLHAVLIVGYDDIQNCWIAKNSWGLGFAPPFGYFRIAYGECKIDEYAKFGARHTNPDPWTKRRLHSGNIIESGNGSNQNNFEMIATAGSRIRHWWRNNGTSGLPWNQGSLFGNDALVCPTVISTTFNRNFELVYLTGSHRLHHWYFEQSSNTWRDFAIFGPTDAAGVPGFIQSSYGKPGNFEVVVKTADSRLNHWWRINHDPWTWNDAGRFGNNVAYSGASLVQSTSGNLELVCVLSNGQMQHWKRTQSGWQPGFNFGSNVASSPCMIEGQYGASTENRAGNYELCVAVGGQIQHWWRNNQSPGFEWNHSATFGHHVAAVAGLLEGSFGFNLELIVLRNDNQLQHYWRDGGGWHEGVIIGTA